MSYPPSIAYVRRRTRKDQRTSKLAATETVTWSNFAHQLSTRSFRKAQPRVSERRPEPLSEGLWVPKMPSESFRPDINRIDEFNFDSAFVNSDNSASHSLGQTNLRKIRPSFRDGPFGLFRRINLIAPSRFLRLDLPPISIREHINRADFKLPADTGDAGHRPRRLR
jgi:hypothetical protein